MYNTKVHATMKTVVFMKVLVVCIHVSINGKCVLNHGIN